MSEDARVNERVLSTLNTDGSRRWIRPRLSKGRFLFWRRIVGYALIAFFVTLPHLRIAGKPPILIDLPAREFTFWGTTLYPTDTLLLALLLLSIFVTIFLVTAVFGRVWCGWACPQTVYLELLFRPIERLLEGAPGHRAKPGTWRKPLRFMIYLAISFLLANTFLAYFVGTDRLRLWVFESPLEHFGPFLLVMAVTALMLFDFGYFREQLCILACPYGRFQSVMLDKESLIITYDPIRGEPRGPLRKRPAKGTHLSLPLAQPPAGDCIDCKMCVTTCPTGIDIRDGLQLECINCAQCIDACDSVMDKIGRPRGLIRYDSQSSVFEGGKNHFLRTRTWLYALIVLGIFGAFVGLLITRSPADVSILRGPGLPYTVAQDGSVLNPLRIKIQNRTGSPVTYRVEGVVDDALVRLSMNPDSVEPGSTFETPAMLIAPREHFVSGNFPARIRIAGSDGFEQIVTYRMYGPAGGDEP